MNESFENNIEKKNEPIEVESIYYVQKNPPTPEEFSKNFPGYHIENIKGKSILIVPVEGSKIIKICFGKQKSKDIHISDYKYIDTEFLLQMFKQLKIAHAEVERIHGENEPV